MNADLIEQARKTAHLWDKTGRSGSATLISNLVNEIDRLSAQQREPVVKVKALDWIEREGVAGTFDASTSVGHYIATITDDDRGMWFLVGQTTGEYTKPDIDAVRAAAQADYEQRIMAAIDWKQLSETGKELPENTEHSANIADVSVEELAQYLNEYIFKDVDDVARALLSRYSVGRRG